MRKLFLTFIVIVLFVLPTVGQEDSNMTVFLRVAHFASDSAEVDIYINDNLTLESANFTSVSDWLELDAGDYTVDVVPTGEAIDDAVLSDTVLLNAGDWVTVAVVGAEADESLAIEVTVEDMSNLSDESTLITVFHAIPDLNPINVVLDEEEIITGLGYLNTLTEDNSYTSVSGDYALDVQDADGNSLIDLETTRYDNGVAYLLAIVGTVDDPQIIVIPTEVAMFINDEAVMTDDIDADGIALVRIGHFAVSAPDVDIYLNDELVLEATRFGDVTDYIELDAGTYTVGLVQTGESLNNALYSGEIELVSDSITLIAAIGFVENDTLEIVTATEDNLPSDTSFSRVAFFQAIPGINTFNVFANNNRLIQGVVYPSASGNTGDGYVSVDILAGTYDFEVTGTNISLDVGTVTVGVGRVYLIVTSGTETSPIYFLISGDFPLDESE